MSWAKKFLPNYQTAIWDGKIPEGW
jgi:hypothetical protein